MAILFINTASGVSCPSVLGGVSGPFVEIGRCTVDSFLVHEYFAHVEGYSSWHSLSFGGRLLEVVVVVALYGRGYSEWVSACVSGVRLDFWFAAVADFFVLFDLFYFFKFLFERIDRVSAFP